MNARIPSYAVASLPEKKTVLGVRLRPFSLGHYILMQRFGIPWVSEDVQKPTVQGLILGVIICACSYEEFTAWQESRNWWEDKFIVGTIARRIRKSDFLTRFPFLNRFYRNKWDNDVVTFAHDLCNAVNKTESFSLLEEIHKFSKYIEDGSQMPHYIIEKESKNTGAGGNWAHNVLVTLTSQLGYSQSEALNMPLSKALYDYMAHASSLGIVKLFTHEEELEFAHHEAMRKELNESKT